MFNIAQQFINFGHPRKFNFLQSGHNISQAPSMVYRSVLGKIKKDLRDMTAFMNSCPCLNMMAIHNLSIELPELLKVPENCTIRSNRHFFVGL